MAKGYNAIPVGFRRVDNQPLEANTVFSQYEDAANYAANDPTAYMGQLISVVADLVYIYYIDENRQLQVLKSTPKRLEPVESPYTINHNLGGYPAVKMIDNQGKLVMADIRYLSESRIELRWNGSFVGFVYLGE
jgi:hypothetical protein